MVEVTALKATIQFSDGIIRKIASSHFTILQPADPASFVQIPDSVPVAKVRATAKRVKKMGIRNMLLKMCSADPLADIP